MQQQQLSQELSDLLAQSQGVIIERVTKRAFAERLQERGIPIRSEEELDRALMLGDTLLRDNLVKTASASQGADDIWNSLFVKHGAAPLPQGTHIADSVTHQMLQDEAVVNAARVLGAARHDGLI